MGMTTKSDEEPFLISCNKTTLTVAGNIYAGFSKISFYLLTPIAVTGIGMVAFCMLVVTQMMVQFSLEHLPDATFVQPGKKAFEFLPALELL